MSEAPSQSRSPDPVRIRTFAALGHPGFRRFFAGQAISLIGTWLQAAAVRWLVFEQTHSEFLLGVVEVASLMPGLLVGLLAGAIADRVTPLKMILLMECGQMLLALLLAALVAVGVVPIWQMAAILALTRICVTFELPSRQVFFYELVGPETLPNAIALYSGLFNATRVIGPALAGICLTYLGAAGCFALNGLSYLAAIAAVLSIRLERPERAKPHANFTLREVLGGLHYLKHDRRISSIFVIVTFFGVVGMGYDAMIPAYTQRVVKAGVYGYSILLSCSGHRRDARRRLRRVAGQAAAQGSLGHHRDADLRRIPGRGGDDPDVAGLGRHEPRPAGGGGGLPARRRLRCGRLLRVGADDHPARFARSSPRPDHGHLDDRLLGVGPDRGAVDRPRPPSGGASTSSWRPRPPSASSSACWRW